MVQARKIRVISHEMSSFLAEKLIPFWLDRSVDVSHGGFLTSFDENGAFDGNDTKYVVMQCRMIWGFSYLLSFARAQDKEPMKAAAMQGVRFLADHFHDPVRGGFYWQVHRDGRISDPAKLIYGEGFAVYALSEFARTYDDAMALNMARETFDLMQKYAADTRYGGYYENLEADWSLSAFGKGAGDRKSLDIHMHILEAFTALWQATKEPIHLRKLQEILDLLMDRMVDRQSGYGYNQFDPAFRRLPAIDIPRTWNAERKSSQRIDRPMDTTSYGHNVELSWLADLAIRTMGIDREPYEDVLRKLLDHALAHGYDREFHGVYRDGIGDKGALIRDKEWWQNFESMVGFINGYVLYRDEKYLDAFLGLWDFIKSFFLDHELGECHQLLDREGKVLVGNLGNPWKGIYHTGRALAECIKRLELLDDR